jgi:hypothetical protein
VRGGKCIVLRPKSRPLHTLGTNLKFWKVFCKILSAGKRTYFPRELDTARSMSGQVGYSLSDAKSAYLNFAGLVFLDTL